MSRVVSFEDRRRIADMLAARWKAGGGEFIDAVADVVLDLEHEVADLRRSHETAARKLRAAAELLDP